MIQNKTQNTFALRCLTLILFIAAAIFSVAADVRAADGDLDTSFGTGGKISTDLGSTTDNAVDTILQPDGKIILVGVQDAGSQNRLALVRYNPNGSLDATFGTGGKVLINNNLQFGTASAAALQADGKIVVTLDRAGVKIVRLNTNGSIDTTFGTNGFATIPQNGSGGTTSVRDLVVLPDGKILIGGGGYAFSGSTITYGFGLYRLNQNGSFDTTFGTNGFVLTDFPGATLTQGQTLALRADGKILLGGFAYRADNMAGTKLLLALYNADGSLDTTFGTGGKVITDSIENSVIQRVVFQSDNKIVTGGSTNNDTDGTRGQLRRYTADGAVDATFGTNGLTTVRINSGATKINDIVLQPDGKIIGFGQAFDLPSIILGFAVVRYLPNGTPDMTFGTNGFRTTVFTTETGDLAEAVTGFLQPDGKIVAAGIQNSTMTSLGGYNFAAARYLNTAGSVSVNNPALRVADFDGDGKTDASVFRNGIWYINPSSNPSFAPQGFYGTQFGLATDKLVPADYDGDGKTDIAVWRAGEAAYFYILNSSNNTFRSEQFGRTGDNPMVVGRWDGDGKADLAVYRGGAAGAASYFYYRPSSQSNIDFETLYWGTGGDEAVRGDFDGDGKLDAAVFRPSNGVWYIRQSSDNQARYESWGTATDKRVSGDFDGDGKTDLAIYRDGLWAIRQSSNNQAHYEQFGQANDIVVAGDYDGDGKTDLAVWRSGTFYIQRSDSSFSAVPFGAAGDAPIAAAFIR
ncbi:MAG: FG-GAP-like repeat-containing protein [Acidobacteriota bacterium]|nr:FG-GAP-like repeat-containing protein [Acidobacteriota bacterium]